MEYGIANSLCNTNLLHFNIRWLSPTAIILKCLKFYTTLMKYLPDSHVKENEIVIATLSNTYRLRNHCSLNSFLDLFFKQSLGKIIFYSFSKVLLFHWSIICYY